MSAANWLEQIRRVEGDNARMRAKLAALEVELDFFKSVFGERTRKVLPKDHPREEGTGRALVECRICYQRLPQRGHGICHRCYNRMYYRKVTFHKRMGGKWMPPKDLKKILGREKGGILPS